MLQKQINKTCFQKCFPNSKYPDQLQKNDQICLAKCMDRMIEAHSVVVRRAILKRGPIVESRNIGGNVQKFWNCGKFKGFEI